RYSSVTGVQTCALPISRTHDERVRARGVGEETHAAQELAVRDARRSDDHLLGREVVDREDAIDVVDAVLARRLDLGAARRPQLRDRKSVVWGRGYSVGG